MNTEASPARKLRRFHPAAVDLEGRVTVSSLFPGISPSAMGPPQSSGAAGHAAPLVEIQARQAKPATVRSVAPLPSTLLPVTFTATGAEDRSSAPTLPTVDFQIFTSFDANATAIDPILATAGSESDSTSHRGPTLSPPVSQPQGRGVSANFETQTPAATPLPPQTYSNANAGAIRPLSMAPTDSAAAASALTAAVASVSGAKQAVPAIHRLPNAGHGTGLRPMDGSGGGGGGLTAAPFLSYSGADGASGDTRVLGDNPVYDIIGDGVQMTVGDANGNAISSVSWSISTSNVYAGQSDPTQSRTGFASLNHPYTPPQNTPPNPIVFDWGETAGNYTISATVNYVDDNPPQDSVTMYVNTARPASTVTVNSMGTPYLDTTSDPSWVDLRAAADGDVGISYTANISTAYFKAFHLSGTWRIGVIQTIDLQEYYMSGSQTYTASVLGAWGSGSQTLPRPVADDAGAVYDANAHQWNYSFLGTFYLNNFLTVNASSTNTSLTNTDTPVAGTAESNDYLCLAATFEDTLMLGTYGGIWVPLGNFSWMLNMSAENNGTSQLPNWAMITGQDSYHGYAQGSEWPNWIDSNYYLWTNYGIFVRTS